MSLKDQHILIIGGGSGIGFAVTSAALAEGARVTIASTGAERLAQAAARLGGAIDTAVLDITDEAAVSAFFAGARFDHIVSTAGDWGKARRGPLADMDLNDARALFGGAAPRSPTETSLLQRAGAARAEVGIRSSVGDPQTNVVDKGTVTRDILAAPSGAGQFAQAVAGNRTGG